MNNNLNLIISDLQIAFNSFDEMEDPYYDFMPIAEKIIKRLEALPNSIEALPLIFKLIEQNEDIDYGLGAPGDIGHFLESFYNKGYEKYLLDSITRKPSSYSVFLLQRIIRDDNNNHRTKYISLLRNLALDKNLDEELREEIMATLSDFE